MTLALAPRIAAGADCFTETEWRAAHVRVLQTELNVAQLECGNVAGANYDTQYKGFIDKFKDRLKADALLLRAHFKRLFGKSYETEMDKFVTKLANDASDRSMKDLKFCANSAGLFTNAIAIDVPNFEQAAVDRVVDHTEVGDECTAASATPITATATTKSTKSTTTKSKSAVQSASVKSATAKTSSGTPVQSAAVKPAAAKSSGDSGSSTKSDSSTTSKTSATQSNAG